MINLPFYTGDICGIRGVYGRRVNKGIAEGKRAGPILKVVQIRGAEELVSRICKPKDLHRVGFVQACIRNPFYDPRTGPEDEEYVWVNLWISHNDKGTPRGMRYATELFTEDPLEERDEKAISGLGQEIGPDGKVRTMVRPMLFVTCRPRGDRHNATEVPPPPPKESHLIPVEQARGCGKLATDSTRGVCSSEGYKPHGPEVPAKAPPTMP